MHAGLFLVPRLAGSKQSHPEALGHLGIVPAAVCVLQRNGKEGGFQVALSMVALISAGLFVRSLRNAQAVNPGFITENILLAGFNLGREGYTRPQGVNFQRQLVAYCGR